MSRRALIFALPVWTLFVWATRIRNVSAQGGDAGELVLPSVLTALALWALVDRRRGVPVLGAATVAVWGVRLPLVLVHDHSVGFKVVHAALAAVSVGLVVASWRALGRRAPVLSLDPPSSGR